MEAESLCTAGCRGGGPLLGGLSKQAVPAHPSRSAANGPLALWRRHPSESSLAPARQLLAEGGLTRPPACCWASAAVVPLPGPSAARVCRPPPRTAGGSRRSPGAATTPNQVPLIRNRFGRRGSPRMPAANRLGLTTGSCSACCRWRRRNPTAGASIPREQSEILLQRRQNFA